VTLRALEIAGLLALLPAAFGGTMDSGHPEERFGRQLPIVKSLGVGPSMDAAVVGDTLYAIGRGKLHVADITEPASPRLVGTLTGLGNTRQIEVSRGVAYITARADGLFVVDVAERERPKLLCHYDTVELATGIALSGDVAFVACRNFGVELVDVTDPRRPRHLSTVRTGEAQSVVARDGILYAGVWGSRELVICDASNPRKPTVISKTPLDGYGDGLCVRGRYCYVATGHHSRACRRRQEGAPGYGGGHGLEIFDIAEPAAPRFVSRIKMPPFYAIGMDMWDVVVTGPRAFVADTHNGLFVVDIADLRKPRFLAHRQLGWVARRKRHSPVGGIALGNGVVYVAGAWCDLHVVAAPGLACPPEPEPDRPPRIPPAREPAPDPRFRVYRPDGQVYGVAFAGDTALVAAGAAGLHAVRLWPKIEKLAAWPTEGFAMDVKVLGDRVYVAEGKGGLSIWRRDGEAALAPLGRYRARGRSVRQVVVPPPGRYALLAVGSSRLHIVDVADAARPTRALDDARPGILYNHQIAEGLLEGRFACCNWHVTSAHWYDLYGGPKPVFTGERYPFRIGSRNGIALREHDGLVTHPRGYFVLRRGETRSPDELPHYGIPGLDLGGKPSLYGTTLYVSDRSTGSVSALDVSELTKPKLLGRLELEGNPCPVVAHKGAAIIPAGYQGLLVWDHHR